MADYDRSERRMRTYALVAESGLIADPGNCPDNTQRGVAMGIEYLALAVTIHPKLIDQQKDELEQAKAQVAIASHAALLLQESLSPTSAILLTLQNPQKRLAREYLVGKAGEKAGTALKPSHQRLAKQQMDCALDTITRMTVDEQNVAMDMLLAIEDPLSRYATLLTRLGLV